LLLKYCTEERKNGRKSRKANQTQPSSLAPVRCTQAQHLLHSAIGVAAWNVAEAMVDLRGWQPGTGGNRENEWWAAGVRQIEWRQW